MGSNALAFPDNRFPTNLSPRTLTKERNHAF
jgi:hypothetical protein